MAYVLASSSASALYDASTKAFSAVPYHGVASLQSSCLQYWRPVNTTLPASMTQTTPQAVLDIVNTPGKTFWLEFISSGAFLAIEPSTTHGVATMQVTTDTSKASPCITMSTLLSALRTQPGTCDAAPTVCQPAVAKLGRAVVALVPYEGSVMPFVLVANFAPNMLPANTIAAVPLLGPGCPVTTSSAGDCTAVTQHPTWYTTLDNLYTFGTWLATYKGSTVDIMKLRVLPGADAAGATDVKPYVADTRAILQLVDVPSVQCGASNQGPSNTTGAPSDHTTTASATVYTHDKEVIIIVGSVLGLLILVAIIVVVVLVVKRHRSPVHHNKTHVQKAKGTTAHMPRHSSRITHTVAAQRIPKAKS